MYLLVYAFTNLGAFAVVIAVARKTRSGEITSYGGLIQYAPGLAVMMTLFLASLTGIPPLGGWIAKFNTFKTLLDAATTSAYVLAVIGAVNTAIASAYYLRVLREIWMNDPPDGDKTPIVTPQPITAALAITDGRHDRARRAARPRHALRRPPGPHRRPRALMRAACPVGRRATSGPPSTRRAGRSRTRRSCDLALYGPHGFYTDATPPGDAVTSSRRRRSARCSAPWSPATSTRCGTGSTGRTRSRSSTPAPGRGRWPAPCWPPAGRARLRCATSPSRCRRRSGPSIPDGVESRADMPAGPIDGVVLANELLDNLPFRLAVHDGAWREAFVTAAPDGSFAEVLSAPFDPLPPVLPRRGRPRGAGTAAGGRRRTG